MKIKLPRFWEKVAFVATGLGAANLGLSEFLKIDLLSYVSQYGGAIANQVAIGVIAIAGVYTIVQVWNKQI